MYSFKPVGEWRSTLASLDLPRYEVSPSDYDDDDDDDAGGDDDDDDDDDDDASDYTSDDDDNMEAFS